MNSEEAVNTTAWLADLIAKGYANVEPITDEFLNGACATMIGGSWKSQHLNRMLILTGRFIIRLMLKLKKQFPHVVTGQQQSPKTARLICR